MYLEDTDYPVSIVLYFWDIFWCISWLFFISLNCFSPIIFFSLLAPLVYSIVFFLCLIINFFLSFLSTTLHELVANSILWLPRVLYFSSFFSDGTNKWSHSIFVFSVLNRGLVSFITKQGGIHIFRSFNLCSMKKMISKTWLIFFVSLKVHLMQYKDIKNPVLSLICIISFPRIDLLWSESANSPSLSNKLSKFYSVSQTSTVLGRLAGDCWLCSNLDLQHIFLPLSIIMGTDEL